jgi:hypothetical protein
MCDVVNLTLPTRSRKETSFARNFAGDVTRSIKLWPPLVSPCQLGAVKVHGQVGLLILITRRIFVWICPCLYKSRNLFCISFPMLTELTVGYKQSAKVGKYSACHSGIKVNIVWSIHEIETLIGYFVLAIQQVCSYFFEGTVARFETPEFHHQTLNPT